MMNKLDHLSYEENLKVMRLLGGSDGTQGALIHGNGHLRWNEEEI